MRNPKEQDQPINVSFLNLDCSFNVLSRYRWLALQNKQKPTQGDIHNSLQGIPFNVKS